MKTRNQAYGKANIIGKKVEQLRKEKNITQKEFIAMLQVAGLDINPTSYSKLEGQLRCVSDRELFYIAQVLRIDIAMLFEGVLPSNL
jgi:transcriptional regulator with XRE-family HTH domain